MLTLMQKREVPENLVNYYIAPKMDYFETESESWPRYRSKLST